MFASWKSHCLLVVMTLPRLDQRKHQPWRPSSQVRVAQSRLHDQGSGGIDVEAGAERTVGDAAVDDVLDELMQGREHTGVLARQRLGQMIVVVGQAAVDLVLGG